MLPLIILQIQYIGEHLTIGKIGNAFVLLSFLSAIVSTYFYFFYNTNNSAKWLTLARTSFRLHSIFTIGIIATLFYMLYKHYFEYEYIWHHSSKNMPMKYIFSCFWEGQEGSFLLWSFWHIVLGGILIKTSKQWEPAVMTVVSVVQVFLSSMLLGVYVLETKIGSNPFTLLLREAPDFVNLPVFKNPNYLEKIDGRGLNPLLQNYWMTIHPPTLFLGFALTLIPFSYAIAGLWKQKYTEWIRPALPWAFTGILVLGAGILMGGAWAYEALSFGGFWAWDPVENSSLVPWLVLVAAAHLMLVNKNKVNSLVLTLFLSLIAFVLILYSTFLTRSGILGETSVHAFTDLGMSGQLLIYLLFFLAISLFLLIKNWKKIPQPQSEEPIWSREFWMFLGALVLIISSFHILFNTSLPVWNKLFNLKLAPPKDAVQYYNSWQIPFAFLITLLIAIGQFLNYKQTSFNLFVKKISISLIISIAIAILISVLLSYNNIFYSLLCFSSVFAVVANADYFLRILNGSYKNAGPSIAHIGFGLLLLGALISTSKKQVISVNTSSTDVEGLDTTLSNNTNILLTLNDTLQMGEYYVSYSGKEKIGPNMYFNVNYLKKDDQGNYKPEFSLSPLVQMNDKMGNVAEPDTKHFIDKDIYTHVTYANLEILKESNQDKEYTEPVVHKIAIGDTIYSSNAYIVLNKLDASIDKTKYNLAASDIAVAAKLSVYDYYQKTYKAYPVFVIRNSQIEQYEDVVNELGLKFKFIAIHPTEEKVELELAERKENKKDFIVMQALIFPYINILWLGCGLMIIGTAIAIVNRLRFH